jgi:hypothetical protein
MAIHVEEIGAVPCNRFIWGALVLISFICEFKKCKETKHVLKHI